MCKINSENHKTPNKVGADASMGPEQVDKLASLLSLHKDNNLFKIAMYLDFKMMSGSYSERIEAVRLKYSREPQTVKNYIFDVDNMPISRFRKIVNQIKEFLS